MPRNYVHNQHIVADTIMSPPLQALITPCQMF